MIKFLGAPRFTYIEYYGAIAAGVWIGNDRYLAGFCAFVIAAVISLLVIRTNEKREGWKL